MFYQRMESKAINRPSDNSDDDDSVFRHAHKPYKNRDTVTMMRPKENVPEEEEEEEEVKQQEEDNKGEESSDEEEEEDENEEDYQETVKGKKDDVELDKEEDDNKETITVDNNTQMMKNNVPFKCFMQCMQEERFHEENYINENVSVAMQAPDSIFFQDKKPSLANASRMMNQLIDLNPHFNLTKELIPDTMAL